MGGGDLNMKKHFHPLTMENLERVWKAEQKAKAEKERIEQLQAELAEERRREELEQHAIEQGVIKKKSNKLDWMYNGQTVNQEEYLLGKKIDKNVDILKEEDTVNELPGASFKPEKTPSAVDLAAKIKEDPLFLIKKKEEENRKELIENPIKLRKLREILHASVKQQTDKRKKGKKKKKKQKVSRKKSKKDRYRDEDSFDSLSDATTNSETLSRHRDVEEKVLTGNQRKRKQREEEPKSRSIKSKSDKHKQNIKKRKQNRTSDISSKDSSSSPEQVIRHRQNDGHKDSKPSRRKRCRESDDSSDDSPLKTRKVKESHRGDRLLDERAEGNKRLPRSEDREGSGRHDKSRSYNERRSNVSKTLSKEELDRRREEMLGNARWRDQQRGKNMKKYQEEEEEDKVAMTKQYENYDRENKAKFIRDLHVKSYSSGSTASVEDRIKRNIYSKQRTQSALDKKFTHR